MTASAIEQRNEKKRAVKAKRKSRNMVVAVVRVPKKNVLTYLL